MEMKKYDESYMTKHKCKIIYTGILPCLSTMHYKISRFRRQWETAILSGSRRRSLFFRFDNKRDSEIAFNVSMQLITFSRSRIRRIDFAVCELTSRRADS